GVVVVLGEVRTHPDVHEVQPRHPTEIEQVTVEDGADLVVEEGLQGRGPADRDGGLCHPVVGRSEQHDFTVAPRLFGCPLDDLRMVVDVLWGEEGDLFTGGTAHTATFHDDGRVTAVGE